MHLVSGLRLAPVIILHFRKASTNFCQLVGDCAFTLIPVFGPSMLCYAVRRWAGTLCQLSMLCSSTNIRPIGEITVCFQLVWVIIGGYIDTRSDNQPLTKLKLGPTHGRDGRGAQLILKGPVVDRNRHALFFFPRVVSIFFDLICLLQSGEAARVHF